MRGGAVCHSLRRLLKVAGNGRLNVHLIRYGGSIHCINFVYRVNNTYVLILNVKFFVSSIIFK